MLYGLAAVANSIPGSVGDGTVDLSRRRGWVERNEVERERQIRRRKMQFARRRTERG